MQLAIALSAFELTAWRRLRGRRRLRRRWYPRNPWRGDGFGLREEAFDDPATWENGEADLIGQLADDFDDHSGRACNAFGDIGGVGEDALDERIRTARGLKQRHRTFTVVHRGRKQLDCERPAVSINQPVTIAAVDLPGVEASRTLAFRSLH